MVVAPADHDGFLAQAFDLGAHEVVGTPVNPRELAVRIRGQISRKQRQETDRSNLSDGLRLAFIDPLTGLYNRRYAVRQLERMDSAKLKLHFRNAENFLARIHS